MPSRKVLKKGIDEANRRAKSDKALEEILNQYDGKHFVLNMLDDTTYVIAITSKGLILTTSTIFSLDDMYLEIDSKTFKNLISGKIDQFKVMSMVLTGKIKFRNIGTKEIDLVKRIINTSAK